MKKPTLKRYLISFGVAFVLTFLVLLAMGGLKSGIGAQWRLKHISDACFTVGALMFGIGILMWASGEGMFDMLSYSILLLFRVRTVYERETFAEYKERKRGKRTSAFLTLLLPGILLLLVAAFCAVYYERV